jgi:hypothetical protein
MNDLPYEMFLRGAECTTCCAGEEYYGGVSGSGGCVLVSMEGV